MRKLYVLSNINSKFILRPFFLGVPNPKLGESNLDLKNPRKFIYRIFFGWNLKYRFSNYITKYLRTFYKSSFFLKNLNFLGLFSFDLIFKKLNLIFGSSFKYKFKNKFILSYFNFFNKNVLNWWCKIKPFQSKFRNKIYFSDYHFFSNFQNVIGGVTITQSRVDKYS